MPRHALSTAAALRQARRALARLGMPGRFTMEMLRARIEQQRQRRVHVVAANLPTLSFHGVWIATADADYVFHSDEATGLRRHQIVGHEFGHILFDDPSASMPDDAAPVLLAYDESTERRAEMFGTLVVQRVITEPGTTTTGRPPILRTSLPGGTDQAQQLDADVIAQVARVLGTGPDHA